VRAGESCHAAIRVRYLLFMSLELLGLLVRVVRATSVIRIIKIIRVIRVVRVIRIVTVIRVVTSKKS
jgi:hypothetical protein